MKLLSVAIAAGLPAASGPAPEIVKRCGVTAD
jgi:hypothetical protein